MLSEKERLSTRRRLLGVSLTLCGYAACAGWLQREQLLAQWPLLAGLALGASLATLLSSYRRQNEAPRLAPTFVLAAALLLPPPAALLVTVCAASVGRGGALFGARSSGLHGFAVSGLAVALAEPLGGLVSGTELGLPLIGPVALLLAAQGTAFVVGPLFGAAPTPLRRMLIGATVECWSLPLAWLLAAAVSRRAWGEAVAIASLTLAVSLLLRLFVRSRAALSQTRRSLTSRLAELETLQAFGRELLSSLEPDRIYATLDRECRRVFCCDAFSIALVSPDRDQLVVVYRCRRGEAPQREEIPLDPGTERWIRRHKTAFRADDLDRSGPSLPFLDGYHSALGAPLIVEGRIVGLLAIYSVRFGDYDADQRSLLATMAQQAAVVVENAKHYQQATIDSLTGCFLRDHLFRRLQEEHRRVLRYGGEFSLLMVDLDSFKPINDEHGHLVGDQYLRTASHAIRDELRSADVACRFGGDEFCLLLPETGLQGARVIAERVREAVAGCVLQLDGLSLCTTASIGIAVFPDHDGGGMRGLLRNADRALYRAKRAGRDRVEPFAA